MKTACVLLLTLVWMGVCARARPTEPDVLSEVQNVHSHDPSEPQVFEEEHTETAERERVRRSPEDKNRGTLTGGVHRQPGVGTVVQAQGQGNIWTSKDGNAKVDAHGDWSKVVDGPGRGKPNHSGGITFSGRF